MSSASPASDFVADTIALILRIGGRRLGPAAKAAFELMEAGNGCVYVPGVVFAEILYLSRKRRIQTTLTDVAQYMANFTRCKEAPLDFAVMQHAAIIDDVPDLHDRLISATANCLGLNLITNDSVITASKWV